MGHQILQILMILSASHLCFSELSELIFIRFKRTKSDLLVSQSYKVIPLDASESPELPSSENSDKIPGKPKLNQVKEASTKQRSLYNPVKFLAEINQSPNTNIHNQFTDFKHSNYKNQSNFSTFVHIYLS